MSSRKVILVADDEVVLRNVIRSVLHNEGYTVLAAADGNEALGVSRAHKGTIDLLLTDVVMPHMDGVSAFRLISAERPGIRVLFMSGGIPKLLKLPDESPFLAKPFATLDVLRIKVRELLEVPSYAAVARHSQAASY